MKRSVIAVVALLLACDASTSSKSTLTTSRGDVARGVLTSARGTSSQDVRVSARSDVLAEAAAALAEGRPWRATLLLEPVVRDSARRTPAAVLLAARAAAGWEGWRRVEQLLGDEPTWLDTLAGGEGRALLARAALDRRADTVAIRHAERAVQVAPDSQRRGERLVLAARAHDRSRNWPIARELYRRSAANLPDVADWLMLRAAAVTMEDSIRDATYRDVRAAPARARVAWTEAAALERFGMLSAAAAKYDSLGAPVSALRLRFMDAAARGDTAASAAARAAALALVQRGSGGTVRETLQLLDENAVALSAAQELVVARAAADAGASARAASGFARAFEAQLGTDRDRFEYGQVLFRLGRFDAAVSQFARVSGDSPLAASAAYQRARALLRDGRGSESRTALRQILTRFASDTSTASSALFLLADLASDEERDGAARAAYRDLARQYPTSDLAANARFRAAMIAFVDGAFRTAALELDTLRSRYRASSEVYAATYWSGRSWARAGDSAAANVRWRSLVTDAPLSYYGMVAARRLGERPWAPTTTVDSVTRDPSVDAAVRRAKQLAAVGMDPEARLEIDALAGGASGSAPHALVVGAALRELGETSRAIALANRMRGDESVQAYRLRFPVVQEPVLVAESARHGLDLALVAALIRQESSFMPRATSPAGARGLMQLMPSVGRQVATGLRFPLWDVALLHQPDVNVQLGTRHLASLLRSYDGDESLTLAAYNAGGSRVTRWLRKRGTDDREVFIERIPYVETRDYVRIILRNKEMYRALYGWPAPARP